MAGLKVSGFTFLRNAVKFGYPYLESINSILPIVDEFIVMLGPCDDGTREGLQAIGNKKIKIIDSVWDDSLREGGRVYAIETDKAKKACNPKSDWLFYLQADEVIHEQYLPIIRSAMQRSLYQDKVDGLLFDYIHFYGDYNHTVSSRSWYRREIRIIRNLPEISSYRDAQGFRKEGKKLTVRHSGASVYHYGWVKHPKTMQAKAQTVHRYWHDDKWIEDNIPQKDVFEYESQAGLEPWLGGHPVVMMPLVDAQDWEVEFVAQRKRPSLKWRTLNYVERNFGKRFFEYRNYKLIPG